MGKWLSRLAFAFLIILATLGMLAYVMQNALDEPITFKEFFQRYLSDLSLAVFRLL